MERRGGREKDEGRHGLSDDVCSGSRGMGRELDREIEPMIAYPPLFLTNPNAKLKKKQLLVVVRNKG